MSKLVKLSADFKALIEDTTAAMYPNEFRTHLGASVVGHSCVRHIWYNFRWAYLKKVEGRLGRLFNTGHRYEDRIVEWLTKAGCQVARLDPVTNKQYTFSAFNGHFGGAGDGFVKLPPQFNFDDTLLLECKTSGTGAKFSNLSKGVAVAMPQHMVQQSIYGFMFKVNYSLYWAGNKNDDSIYISIMEIDFGLAREALRKAEYVINEQNKPARISEDPAYFVCKMCDYFDVCHGNEEAAKNCRSCRYARPVENGEWHCEHYKLNIPKDVIPLGCEEWQSAC